MKPWPPEMPGARAAAAPKPEDPAVVMDRARFRAGLVIAGVVLGYVVLGLRVIPLMLMPDDRLQAKAAMQFQHAVEVEAPRGDILASDGTLLATTVEMPTLHADPTRLAAAGIDPDALAHQIAETLADSEVDVAALAERLRRDGRRDILLLPEVAPERVAALEQLAPGDVLWIHNELSRYYPGRDLAAQLLGVVGRNGRGLEGVERHQDRYLRGTTYRYVEERDRRGRAISTAVEVRGKAQAGDTLRLTLDPYIQRAAEDALDEAMLRSDPIAATVVVLDVETGQVLALANRPTTNANDERGRVIANFRNHAVGDAHEPGSVLKPFVISLALEEGVVTPESRIDCEGGHWRVGSSTINDDHPHGVVEVGEVVKYSSNIGTAKMAFDVGADEVIAGLRRFGFASPTGVDLPSEVAGFLRDPRKIRAIELATTAFGQGMTATPMQLAAAVATLANGGERMQPYVVSEVRDRHGYVRLRNQPRRVERAVSEETAKQMLAMMALVLEEGGTGTRARIHGYTAGGKTGTAQKVVDGHYSTSARVSSFIGVTPISSPKLAIVVQLDTPRQGSKYGGLAAGPVFATIGERALPYLGVQPDAPEPEKKANPSQKVAAVTEPLPTELMWTTDGRLKVPDFAGRSMRDVLATLDGAGLQLALSGSGVAVAQAPSPGTTLAPGERMEVRFQ